MSWIVLTLTIVIIAFGLSFAISEWVANRRRPPVRDDDPAAFG